MNAILTKTKEKSTIKGLSLRSLVAMTLALVFAIVVLTGTDNVLIATIVYASATIIVVCRQRKRQYFYIAAMLGVLARVSVYIKHQLFISRQAFDTNVSIIATGVVNQAVNEGVYTMSVDGQNVRYYTPYQYQAGDIIWFTATVYPTRAPVLVYDWESTQKNRKSMFMKSGFDYNRRLYMK